MTTPRAHRRRRAVAPGAGGRLAYRGGPAGQLAEPDARRLEHSFTQRQAAEDGLRQFRRRRQPRAAHPLTSITGYAQLVRHGALSDPDDLADAMRRVEDEAKRMAALVDELLLLARLDQGRPLESSPVDLVALAEAAVGDARAADCARTVRLVADEGAHWSAAIGPGCTRCWPTCWPTLRIHTRGHRRRGADQP